jgi:multimeric flavodoxin WrbA
VASPTYFANVPAPLKNLFDRLVGVVMNDNDGPIPKPRLSPKQKYLILVTCNTPFPFDKLAKQSTGTVKAIKEFFHISGMTRAGTVVFAGTREKSEIPHRVARDINVRIERD